MDGSDLMQNPDPDFERDMVGHGRVLMISNLEPGDHVYAADFNEHGWITWNVTRMMRDAEAGMHGGLHTFPVPLFLKAVSMVEVDPATVEALRPVVRANQHSTLLTFDLEGVTWLGDGHHRLHAMAMEGIPVFRAYRLNHEVPIDLKNSRYRVVKRRFPDQATLERFKAKMDRQRGAR
jgi:hypothetical protein